MSLPRPPGARLVTLPREPGDKPQEVAVAVNPLDPRNVVASYHQAVGVGSDHHAGLSVDLHVASSTDGGESWTFADDTTHERYLRSLDATVTFDLHGNAFLVYIGMDKMSFTSPTTRNGEYVSRSLDGGRTWERRSHSSSVRRRTRACSSTCRTSSPTTIPPARTRATCTPSGTGCSPSATAKR